MRILNRLSALFKARKWRPDIWTLLLLGAIVYVWFRPPAWVSALDQPAPSLQVRLADGRATSLEQLRGKVVLVNFWATWCPYCRKEMPAIDRFWHDYRGRGLEVVAISVDDPPEKIAAWMKDKGYAFAAAPTNASVTAAFGDIQTVPTSFIVDADGHVRHKISGQVYYGRLEKLIVPLLPRTPAP